MSGIWRRCAITAGRAISPVGRARSRPFFIGHMTQPNYNAAMKRLPLIGAIVFGLAFIAQVGFMWIDPDDYVALDTFATNLAHHLQTLPWVEFFVAITTIGSTTGIIVIALLTAFLLRGRESALRLAILLIAESGTVELVKSYIGRVRPDALPWIGEMHSFSFPSGHSTASMALFGFIAVMAWQRTQGTLARTVAIVIPALLILAIGMSRIVLAAHYFSDVIAGFTLGAFWLCFVFLIPLHKRATLHA